MADDSFDFTAAFQEAYADDCRAFQEAKRAHMESQRQAAIAAFTRMAGTPPSNATIVNSEIWLIATPHVLRYHTRRGDSHWHLRGTCPNCKQMAWSTPCDTMADIGSQLTNFTPDPSEHSCPALEQPIASWVTHLEDGIFHLAHAQGEKSTLQASLAIGSFLAALVELQGHLARLTAPQDEEF